MATDTVMTDQQRDFGKRRSGERQPMQTPYTPVAAQEKKKKLRVCCGRHKGMLAVKFHHFGLRVSDDVI